MRYMLTADTHLGHKKMHEEHWRPEGYEEKIHKGIMEEVKDDDVLIHLGDVSLGDDADMHEKYVKLWPGSKIMIRGNHDKKSDAFYLTHGWDGVFEALFLDKFGKKILLSHIPMADSPMFDVNVHGHFHDHEHATIRAKEPEIAAILCYKHMLLSIEQTHYRPIPLQTMVQQFDARGGVNPWA